jgi:carboxyl-terminal processing protease
MVTQHTHSRKLLIQLALTSTLAALLAACGGGGSSDSPADGGTNSPITDNLSVDPLTANLCAAPRPNTADLPGLLDQEKTWVRALIDKTYLWYRDVPSVEAAAYTAAAYSNDNYRALDAYFRALKTPLRTNSGKLVDEFSFTLPTAQLTNQQAGITSGYGMRLTAISRVVPRNFRVLYVENDSPAAIAGISRGDQITSVDGVNIDDNTAAGLATINSGLAPTIGSKITQFELLAPGAAAPRTVTVTSSQNITVTTVALTKTLSVGTQTVGYLVLNSLGINSAELQLFNAVNQLKDANIQELVLDLRYNGGGFQSTGVDDRRQLAPRERV